MAAFPGGGSSNTLRKASGEARPRAARKSRRAPVFRARPRRCLASAKTWGRWLPPPSAGTACAAFVPHSEHRAARTVRGQAGVPGTCRSPRARSRDRPLQWGWGPPPAVDISATIEVSAVGFVVAHTALARSRNQHGRLRRERLHPVAPGPGASVLATTVGTNFERIRRRVRASTSVRNTVPAKKAAEGRPDTNAAGASDHQLSLAPMPDWRTQRRRRAGGPAASRASRRDRR